MDNNSVTSETSTASVRRSSRLAAKRGESAEPEPPPVLETPSRTRRGQRTVSETVKAAPKQTPSRVTRSASKTPERSPSRTRSGARTPTRSTRATKISTPAKVTPIKEISFEGTPTPKRNASPKKVGDFRSAKDIFAEQEQEIVKASPRKQITPRQSLSEDAKSPKRSISPKKTATPTTPEAQKSPRTPRLVISEEDDTSPKRTKSPKKNADQPLPETPTSSRKSGTPHQLLSENIKTPKRSISPKKIAEESVQGTPKSSRKSGTPRQSLSEDAKSPKKTPEKIDEVRKSPRKSPAGTPRRSESDQATLQLQKRSMSPKKRTTESENVSAQSPKRSVSPKKRISESEKFDTSPVVVEIEKFSPKRSTRRSSQSGTAQESSSPRIPRRESEISLRLSTSSQDALPSSPRKQATSKTSESEKIKETPKDAPKSEIKPGSKRKSRTPKHRDEVPKSPKIEETPSRLPSTRRSTRISNAQVEESKEAKSEKMDTSSTPLRTPKEIETLVQNTGERSSTRRSSLRKASETETSTTVAKSAPTRRSLRKSDVKEEDHEKLHKAASKIQALWRGHMDRKQFKVEKAAVKIQAAVRGHLARKLFNSEKEKVQSVKPVAEVKSMEAEQVQSENVEKKKEKRKKKKKAKTQIDSVESKNEVPNVQQDSTEPQNEKRKKKKKKRAMENLNDEQKTEIAHVQTATNDEGKKKRKKKKKKAQNNEETTVVPAKKPKDGIEVETVIKIQSLVRGLLARNKLQKLIAKKKKLEKKAKKAAKEVIQSEFNTQENKEVQKVGEEKNERPEKKNKKGGKAISDDVKSLSLTKWPKLNDVSKIVENRSKMNTPLLDALKTNYEFLNKIEVIANNLSDQLITSNDELIWQQVANQNKLLFKKFNKIKDGFEEKLEGLENVDLDDVDVDDEEDELSSDAENDLLDGEAIEDEDESEPGSEEDENEDVDDEEEADLFNLRPDDLKDIDDKLDALDSDQETDDENVEKAQKSTKKQRKSVVDDEFFKLADMEEFLEAEDHKDYAKSGLFDEIPDKEEGSADYYYKDFFEEEGPGDMKKAKNKRKLDKDEVTKSSQKPKKVRFVEDEEETPPESDAEHEIDGEARVLLGPVEEDHQPQTSFQATQEKLKKKISKLEEENLGPKSWELAGETTAQERAKDGLLDTYLSVDYKSKNAPSISVDTTEKLEAMIVQRIKDKAFDDVERKVRSDETIKPYRNETVDETTRKSLVDVYEEKFQKMNDSSAQKEEADPQVKEITDQMTDLFKMLDAMSHYMFKPPEITPEVKIVRNMAALRAEEVGPMASTAADEALLAPEEVAKHLKGDLKASEERTETDRLRERRKKKKKQHVMAKKSEDRPAKRPKLDLDEPSDRPKKLKRKIKSKDNKDFFAKLQETTIQEIKEKTKKKDKFKTHAEKALSGKKYKL